LNAIDRFIANSLAFQAISPEFFEWLRAIFCNFSCFSGENKTYIDRAAGVFGLVREMIMRSSIVFVLALFLSILASGTYADDACRCKGCGCKGGPGWRGPDGLCVSKASLAKVCGTPAGAQCKQESATRVCFGRQSALTAPKPAQTQ
jgi:hypothetical protein